MKLFKKIAAIMLSIMMVLGMASVVSAEGTMTSGTSAATGNGTITITNAIAGQTYTIYKMLTLESYDATKGLYSYKTATGWENFFENSGAGSSYVDINENGYVTWKIGADAAALAQTALTYAKGVANGINTKKEATAEGTTVTFSGLELGYYLVDSSAGALCSLDTTKPTVTIKEKNGVPSVEKKVYADTGYSTFNYANIGDQISFLTTVHVKKGAENYIVYDEMSEGFELKENNNLSVPTIQIYANDSESIRISDTDYTVSVNADKKGFNIKFKADFLKKYKDIEYDISIAYAAILTGDAVIGNNGTANTNKAWLTYGDKGTKSTESVTNTYTFGIPVFKYTKDGETKKALAGAKFSLYSDEKCNNIIELIKPSTTEETYRRFITGDVESNKVTIIETTASGEFNITGLDLGTYYLKEIEAPKGYNKLNNAITVKIEKAVDRAKLITLSKGDDEVTRIEVENKSGTILPFTGGMGTTVIYIVGALLVLISGVVLITKKRTDLK